MHGALTQSHVIHNKQMHFHEFTDFLAYNIKGSEVLKDGTN